MQIENHQKCSLLPNSVVPLERFGDFQFIVLVLLPTTLLFWFTLTGLISVVSSHSRKLSSVGKALIHQTAKSTTLADSW